VCTYFNGGKNCPVCPKKCPREAHVRASGKIEIVKKEKKMQLI